MLIFDVFLPIYYYQVELSFTNTMHLAKQNKNKPLYKPAQGKSIHLVFWFVSFWKKKLNTTQRIVKKVNEEQKWIYARSFVRFVQFKMKLLPETNQNFDQKQAKNISNKNDWRWSQFRIDSHQTPENNLKCQRSEDFHAKLISFINNKN